MRVTAASMRRPRTSSCTAVPAVLYSRGTYAMAMLLPRLGEGSPLVTRPSSFEPAESYTTAPSVGNNNTVSGAPPPKAVLEVSWRLLRGRKPVSNADQLADRIVDFQVN